VRCTFDALFGGIVMPDGDQGRWLTYQELAEALGCTANAARMHAVRRKWPRRASNRIGAPVHVLVPEDVDIRRRAAHADEQFDAQCNAPFDARPNGAVPAHAPSPFDAQVVRALESAVDGLRGQLGIANARAEAAEQRINTERERADKAELRADRERGRAEAAEKRADQVGQQLVETRTELVGEKIAAELARQQLLDQRPASSTPSSDSPKIDEPRRRWWLWRR